MHQFSIITELLGTPPEDVIQTIASENVSCRCPYFSGMELTRRRRQTLRFVQSLPKRERVPFSEKLHNNDPVGTSSLPFLPFRSRSSPV